MKEGLLMTMKSLKNDFLDINTFANTQMKENKSCINVFILSDLSSSIKGDSILEITSNKTGTTTVFDSIKDVFIDTDFEDGFATYRFNLNAPYEGKEELVVNVSEVGRHDTNLFKHYLYDIEQPDEIAYSLVFKKK